MVSVIDRLSGRHPGMVFNVVVDETAALKRSLNERHIELAVIRNAPPIFDGRLGFDRLFESPYVVAAGAQNRWVGRRRIALADLCNESLALPAPGQAFGPFVEQAFRAKGLQMPRATVVTSTLEMRANLLRTGRYLSIFLNSGCDCRNHILSSGNCRSTCRSMRALSVLPPSEGRKFEPSGSAIHRLRARCRKVATIGEMTARRHRQCRCPLKGGFDAVRTALHQRHWLKIGWGTSVSAIVARPPVSSVPV